jgi:hypothetical protein
MKIEDIIQIPLEQNKAQSVAIMRGFLLSPDSSEQPVGKLVGDPPVVMCWGENFPPIPSNQKAALHGGPVPQDADARRGDVVVVVLRDDPELSLRRRCALRRWPRSFWEDQDACPWMNG